MKHFIGEAWMIINQDSQPLFGGKTERFYVFRTEQGALKYLHDAKWWNIVDLILGKKRKIIKVRYYFDDEK